MVLNGHIAGFSRRVAKAGLLVLAASQEALGMRRSARSTMEEFRQRFAVADPRRVVQSPPNVIGRSTEDGSNCSTGPKASRPRRHRGRL